MAVAQAQRIGDKLASQGLSPKSPVQIVANVSRINQKIIHSQLSDVKTDLDRHNIERCAIILVFWPSNTGSEAQEEPASSDDYRHKSIQDLAASETRNANLELVI